MQEEQVKKEYGAMFAIAVIIGIVAIAGVYLYQQIVFKNSQSDSEIRIEKVFEQKDDGLIAPDSGSNNEIERIEAELAQIDQELERLDTLEEELLDFSDLDDLDLDFGF